DNDNDGVVDGIFLDFGFPPIMVGGDAIQLAASVLIVDLDSRFNVNAHGSLARSLYLTTPDHSGWSSAQAFSDVPMGSGYGPAEVNADAMFPQAGGTSSYSSSRLQPQEAPLRWTMFGVTGTAQSGRRPSGSRFSLNTPTPRLRSLQGRYGEAEGWATVASGTTTLPRAPAATQPGSPLPGQAGVDDPISRVNDMRTPPAGGATTFAVNEAAGQGIPALWWDGTPNFNWAAAGVGGAKPRTTYNSPPDLHGRMKTTTVGPAGRGVVPQLLFSKPEWGSGETTDDPYELRLDRRAPRNGWMGDPNTNGFMPVFDNIFSVSELEAVLRPYDIDSSKLPMRLAAILGSVAEESRLRLTTDSWDTTMITGSAAKALSDWLKSLSDAGVQLLGTSAVTGAIGGEAARGERFDLNRPLTAVKPTNYNPTHPYYVQRQAYFKDLYTLAVALSSTGSPPALSVTIGGTTVTGTAATGHLAQWAANVVEFRDADSTMTPFEYDVNPSDGWQVNGDVRDSGNPEGPDRAVVWGAERPEALIAATSAWENESTGELFVLLHRPWNAVAFSSDASGPAEPIDPEFDASATNPRNLLDLGAKSGTTATATTFPVWRLRVQSGTNPPAIVRLDATSGTSAMSSDLSSSAITGTAATPKLSVDSWVCIRGNNTINAVITSASTVVIDRGGPLRVPGPLPSMAGQPRLATVYLERLSDPSIEVSSTSIWTAPTGTAATSGTNITVPTYHIVDKAPIEVVNRVKSPNPISGTIPPAGTATTLNRTAGQNTSLWRCLTYRTGISGSAATVDSGPTIAPLTRSAPPDNAVWFTWPNRPFISAAELLFVPSGDAITVLNEYTKPSVASTTLPTPFLLDAVHVPSRFAGINQTVTGAAASTAGVLATKAGIYSDVTPVNQLSSFREPGRVNLN
ncbi:MAG: hypothetical protein DVB22_003300, partial [Verrucomicrobia bacterium]